MNMNTVIAYEDEIYWVLHSEKYGLPPVPWVRPDLRETFYAIFEHVFNQLPLHNDIPSPIPIATGEM